MIKKLCLIAVISVTAIFMLINKTDAKIEETRGIFISYLEYKKYLSNKNEKEIIKEVEKIVTSLKKYHINTIYLQVRMFSDSIYNSKIFPFTDIIDNNKKNNIDLLSIFLKYAKKEKIKIYAWINPYRISSSTNIDNVPKNSPAYIYINTNHVDIIEDKGIYFNPASSVVKNLIIAGVLEIIENYDVDGIMFDDYFYPSKTIDLKNYEEYKNIMSIDEYRLGQVNELIQRVYKTIKSINKNIEFGISPDGNIENNYEYIYADVNEWLSKEGYIDFIMPQLYYGFYNEAKPFIKTVNEWNSLIKNNTKLIVALSLYKSGNVDAYAKKGIDEWLNNTDIIKRQIEYSRTLSHYDGYSLFRYEYLVDYKNSYLDKEIDNYLNFINKEK